MIKISKLADYASLLMLALAKSAPFEKSTRQLAQESHLQLPAIRKILKLLAHAGLVKAKLGPVGGYRLAREPAHITIADILEAIEGPPAITECSSSHSQCDVESHCALRGNWQLINHSIYITLNKISLADMQRPLKSEHILTTEHPLIFYPPSKERVTSE
jgi:FeS assembly SUF system regulator